MDLLTKDDRLSFDPEKHILGVLCKRKHDAGDGRSWRDRKHGHCIQCNRDGAARWKADNPDRAKANTGRRDQKRNLSERRNKYPILLHVQSITNRARAKGMLVQLTADYMRQLWREQEGQCFWTGRVMDFEIGNAKHPFRPSVDRLYPAAGYVEGNVVWSSNFANRARGDLPAEEFAAMMLELGFEGQYDTKLANAAKRFGG